MSTSAPSASLRTAFVKLVLGKSLSDDLQKGPASICGWQRVEFLPYFRSNFGIGSELKEFFVILAGHVAVIRIELGKGIAPIQVCDGALRVDLNCFSQPLNGKVKIVRFVISKAGIVRIQRIVGI